MIVESNELINSAESPDTTSPFRSLAEARLAHSTLLKHRRAAPERGDKVKCFVNRLQSTGSVLWDVSERALAQSMLDYWSTVRNSDVGWSEPLFLAEFDSEKAPQLRDDDCPYVGLNPFGVENQDQFYGRDELVHLIVKRIEEQRFVAITGPSGSGKSSLIQAGVLPILSERAAMAIAGPVLLGPDPLEALGKILATDTDSGNDWVLRHKPLLLEDPHHLGSVLDARFLGRPTLLVIDQFEELFTLVTDDELQQALLRNLGALVSEHPERTAHRLLICVREDYADAILRDPDLAASFNRAQIRLGALNAQSLREVIEKPAEQVGLRFEPGIVEDLVAKVLGEPAALPLLQFTLMALWSTRKRNFIAWSEYEKLGGPRRALALSADQLYKSLAIEEQNTARRIFTRLVQFGDSLEVTSRRVLVSTLEKIEDPLRIRRVIAKFADRRLLRVSGGDPALLTMPGDVRSDRQVEVAHEALIRNWPTLVEWLAEERGRQRQRLQLKAAASLWLTHDRDPGGLIGGSLLEQAQGYDDLSAMEQELVSESQKAERAAQLEREQSQRIREEILEKRVEEERSRAEAAQARAEADRARAEVAEQKVKATHRAIVAGVLAVIVSAVTALFIFNSYKTQQNRKALEQQIKELKEKNLKDQIVITGDRPLLKISGGTFAVPLPPWTVLEEHRAAIDQVLASVGVLHSQQGRGSGSTGFMVGPGLFLTTATSMIDSPTRVSFADRAGSFEAAPFEVTETVLRFRPAIGWELAVLRIRPLAGSGIPLPGPLPIARRVRLEAGTDMYTAGYPHFADDPTELASKIVGDDLLDAKRLQPGRLLRPPEGYRVAYDSSTYKGNGGGPLVALSSGQVFGIHRGVDPGVEKYGILLGNLPERDRLQQLGVIFEDAPLVPR